jgi:hypothetical protein
MRCCDAAATIMVVSRCLASPIFALRVIRIIIAASYALAFCATTGLAIQNVIAVSRAPTYVGRSEPIISAARHAMRGAPNPFPRIVI